jgi:H/ACA ribonucleoprotein complex subunit 3
MTHSKMRRCPSCGRYTLELICVDCKVKTIEIIPVKFSPEDKYGEYRRRLYEQ